MANLFRKLPEVPEIDDSMVRDGGGAPTMAITCPKEQYKAIVQHNGRWVAPGDETALLGRRGDLLVTAIQIVHQASKL